MSKSCARCTFMFFKDTGYSNYTVEGQDVICVFNANPKLPEEPPDTWGTPSWKGLDCLPSEDNWHATMEGRCEKYQERDLEFERVRIDVDHEDIPTEEAAKEAFMRGDVMPLLVRKYFSGEPL